MRNFKRRFVRWCEMWQPILESFSTLDKSFQILNNHRSSLDKLQPNNHRRAHTFNSVQSTLIFRTVVESEAASKRHKSKRLLIRRSIKKNKTRKFSYLIIQVSMLSLLLPLATRARLLILTTRIRMATRFRRRWCFHAWWLLICCWWCRYRF